MTYKSDNPIVQLRRAIAYWENRLAKEPGNEVIRKILTLKKIALKNVERKNGK